MARPIPGGPYVSRLAYSGKLWLGDILSRVRRALFVRLLADLDSTKFATAFHGQRQRT